MFNILVSALNCEKYLETCLSSIVSQAIKCDIILINPRPTKVYNDIKKKFNQNIHFSIEEPDEGCADGLNKGLKYINNHYLCVLNGDDYFLRNSLNTVVKELESKPDILIGNGLVVDSNKYLIKEFKSDRFSFEKLITNVGTVCHQATFYRKKIFEEGVKFNKNNTTSWDAEVLLEAHLKNYNFKYINDFISAFRIHSESITGMGKNKKEVILQQSLYFKRVKGRKINMFDKIRIFINYIVIRIQRIPNKVKAIFQKKVIVI